MYNDLNDRYVQDRKIGLVVASVRYQKIQTNVCAWLSEKRETTISPLQ